MVSRIHFDDESEAVTAAEKIDEAGHEVAIIKERFAGEDDDEAVDYVVATTASPAELTPIVGGEVFVESDEQPEA